jgi:hypothetical protein
MGLDKGQHYTRQGAAGDQQGGGGGGHRFKTRILTSRTSSCRKPPEARRNAEKPTGAGQRSLHLPRRPFFRMRQGDVAGWQIAAGSPVLQIFENRAPADPIEPLPPECTIC